MSNYKSLAQRIRLATTIDKLEQLSKVADKLYNIDQLTVSELKRLDSLVVDKTIELNEKLTDELVKGLENEIERVLKSDLDKYQKTDNIAEILSGNYLSSTKDKIVVTVASAMTKNKKVVQLNNILYKDVIYRHKKPNEVLTFFKNVGAKKSNN